MDLARRNWLAHVVEGGLFMGGMALVNAQTLLPSLAQGLNGPEWLVALMPALMMVGFLLPPVFTAHAIGKLGRFRPLLLWTGAFQRLTYLAAALVLLLTDDPFWCLLAIALAPLLSGLSAGLSLTAWQQLLVRTVGPVHRSSMFAWRYVIGSIIGVGAGFAVQATLAASPGLRGYGLLHLWAFLILACSYVVFSLIREPPEPAPREPETGLWDNLRAMPTVLLADRRLVLLLLSGGIYGLAGAVIPYLAIHARLVCAAPESFLGELVAWQMAGAILGGLAAGWLGDRHGGKQPLQAGRLLFLVVCAVAPFVTTVWGWHLLFFVFGVGLNAAMVGANTLQLDILPERGRANRLAIMSASQLPVLIGASLIGGACWKAWGDAAFTWLALGSAAAVGLSWLLLLRLRDPRGAR